MSIIKRKRGLIEQNWVQKEHRYCEWCLRRKAAETRNCIGFAVTCM